VHLTLAVEVEPPFDWEGALHHALRAWALANAPGGRRTVGEGDTAEGGEPHEGCVHPTVIRSARHRGMYRFSIPPTLSALAATRVGGPEFRIVPLLAA